jgi:hypothetical protein
VGNTEMIRLARQSGRVATQFVPTRYRKSLGDFRVGKKTCPPYPAVSPSAIFRNKASV